MSELRGNPPGCVPKLVAAVDPALSGITSFRLGTELLARVLANELDARSDRYDDHVDNLARLSIELGRRLDVDSNRFSRAYVETRLGTYCHGGPDGPTPVRDATIVEIGCGSRNPLSVLFALVLLGARRGIAVDLDTVGDIPDVVRSLARCAGWMLTDPRLLVGDYPITREQLVANLAATRFDLARLFAGDAGGVDRDRLDYRNESMTRMSFRDGEVDLCCSSVALEHVDDPEAAIAEMARVTRRGGRGIHSIDGVDHRNYFDPNVHPLEFLKEDTSARIVHICNRIRPRAFVKLFERQGFKVLKFHVWRRQEVDPALRATFAEPFRSMTKEDLECVAATFWVERR